MENEIIFSYNNTRCHATIVSELSVKPSAKNYIGKLNNYEIYKTYDVIFNQFEFEAIKID